MRRPILIALLAVLLMSHSAWAGLYMSLSIDQYQRFGPIERFMQYIPAVGVGWEGDKHGFRAVFNLYEEISGATSVHSFTPYTVESYWHIGDHRLEANGLVFMDVRAKDYIETMVEGKVAAAYPVGDLAMHIVPTVRYFESTGLELGAGGGLSWGPLTVGVNLLDTKDHYQLGRNRSVVTARFDTPVSNGNRFVVELHRALGENGREGTWFTYRFDFARILEW